MWTLSCLPCVTVESLIDPNTETSLIDPKKGIRQPVTKKMLGHRGLDQAVLLVFAVPAHAISVQPGASIVQPPTALADPPGSLRTLSRNITEEATQFAFASSPTESSSKERQSPATASSRILSLLPATLVTLLPFSTALAQVRGVHALVPRV